MYAVNARFSGGVNNNVSEAVSPGASDGIAYFRHLFQRMNERAANAVVIFQLFLLHVMNTFLAGRLFGTGA